MKILITGSNGFLGSNLFNHLEDQDLWVVGHSRAKCDLMDREATLKYFADCKPTHVVHSAAACGGILLNHDAPGDLMDHNLSMTANVLRACVECGAEKITLIGTTCSYSPQAEVPLHERDLGKGLTLENATGAYGIAKWTTYHMADAYSSQYGLQFDYLVPSNLYGPNDNFSISSGHVVAAMIRKFSENDNQVSLIGPGNVTRDFLYVGDAVRAIESTIFSTGAGLPINIGSGEETTIAELAMRVADAVGSKAIIEWESRPEIVGHSRRVVDISRAETLLQWKPMVPLGSGLHRTVNWYRRNSPRK